MPLWMEPDELEKGEERIVKLHKFCPLCLSEALTYVRSEQCHFPQDAHPNVVIFNQSWSHLLQCSDCKFAFTQEIPTSPTFFDNRYDNPHFDMEHEVRSNRKSEINDSIIELIFKYKKLENNFLDIGSFAGKMLKRAHDAGFKVMGIEVNPKLAKASREILGFNVKQGKFQEVDIPENYFEVITIIDVLEHLVGPREILEKIQKSLKHDGILLIKVPNYPMQKLKQDFSNKLGISKTGFFGGYGHINQFSLASITNIAKDLNFQLIECYVARSEKWPSDSLVNWFKNTFRDTYWVFANLIYKFLGFNIGMNNIYLLKKKKNNQGNA